MLMPTRRTLSLGSQTVQALAQRWILNEHCFLKGLVAAAKVHFVRSDYLVNKETMQIDTPQALGAAGSPVSAPHHAMTNSTPHNVITGSAPQYVMTNTSHLVYGSTPWAHMLAHPNS